VSTIYRRNSGGRLTAQDWEDAASAGGALLGLLLIAPGMAYQGWALQQMWRWFVSPAFGVPAPGVAVCIGLAVLATEVMPSPPRPRNDDPPHPLLAFGKAMGRTTFYLCLAWVVHLCV